MDSRQIAKTKTCQAIIEFGNKNMTRLEGYPLFKEIFNNLVPIPDLIQKYSGGQLIEIKGKFEAKVELRNNLISLLYETCSETALIAKVKHDKDLLAEMDITLSGFRRMKDEILRDKGSYILEKATAMSMGAGSVITPALIGQLRTALDEFSKAIPQSRISIAEKTGDTKMLKATFAAFDEELSKMDTFMETIRLKEIQLYAIYKSVRHLHESHTTMSVKGTVKDALDSPLKGVKLVFEQTKSADGKTRCEPVVKKTAVKGGYIVKALPAGKYKVTISKEGYADKTESIAVSENEMLKMDVVLLKE